MRARHYAALLKPAELTGDDDDLGLTLEDLVPGLAAQAREPRFLGYYSRQGLELALERHNLLGRLRAKGFEPTLEFNLDDPQRHILKIFGDPDRRELLFELVVRRDRRTIPGFELLAVDWLLLQNPRERFPPDRPALPGQVHPGLGLFDEVVALLIIACERVGLAGLLVTPSQYHLAVQWQKRLRFVDPRAAARMRAIREAMPGMSLTDAALALAAGRVVDDRTGEACSYEPAAMVFPLSDELKAELAPETYLHAVDEAADAFRFRLRPD